MRKKRTAIITTRAVIENNIPILEYIRFELDIELNCELLIDRISKFEVEINLSKCNILTLYHLQPSYLLNFLLFHQYYYYLNCMLLTYYAHLI